MSAYREQAIEVIKHLYKGSSPIVEALNRGEIVDVAKMLEEHNDPLDNLLADLIL
jgi:hypothetical protein